MRWCSDGGNIRSLSEFCACADGTPLQMTSLVSDHVCDIIVGLDFLCVQAAVWNFDKGTRKWTGSAGGRGRDQRWEGAGFGCGGAAERQEGPKGGDHGTDDGGCGVARGQVMPGVRTVLLKYRLSENGLSEYGDGTASFNAYTLTKYPLVTFSAIAIAYIVVFSTYVASKTV